MADRRRPRPAYNNKDHPAVAFALGGIGAGSVAIGADGRLSQWQIFNAVNQQAQLPDSGFGLWAQAEGKPAVARQLHGPPANPWKPHTPCLTQVRMRARYPVAQLEFPGAPLPVQVRLTTYCPLIPHNEKDSALPVAVFSFTLTNRSRRAVRATLLGELQNAVGFSGIGLMTGAANPGFGGNRNRLMKLAGATVLRMDNRTLADDSPLHGSMALAALTPRAQVLTQYDDHWTLWHEFARSGRLPKTKPAQPSPPGRTWYGALAVPVSLKPGQQRQVTFLIAWHFPNRINESVLDQHTPGGRAGPRVGNMYNNWFADAGGVVRYVHRHFDRLERQTMLFRDCFYDATLPESVLDRVGSQIATIRSPTCQWHEDGFFGGYEGCGELAGCCPMNCTHVWNYEHTLAFLFPRLERQMRHTDLTDQMEPDGLQHYRTVLPLCEPRESGLAVDGQLGTVLKTYREYLLGGGDEWLKRYYPAARSALEFIIRLLDPGGEGVLEGPQHNTYDATLYGVNSYMSSFYLAALRAGEEMASALNRRADVKRYREIFDRGSKTLDRLTFNGEYYREVFRGPKTSAKVDKRLADQWWARPQSHVSIGDGCWSDQLIGQWWAHVLGLGYLLPRGHVRQALAAVFKRNWQRRIGGLHGAAPRVVYGVPVASPDDAAMINGTWPKDKPPQKPVPYRGDVFSGVEYQVAAHLIMEGLVNKGLAVADGVHRRYDGTIRNPYSELECGTNYIRPLSSWTLLTALGGQSFHGPKGIYRFAPRLSPDRFKSFYAGPGAWGWFSQDRTGNKQVCRLHVAHGRALLGQLELANIDKRKTPTSLKVQLDQRNVNTRFAFTDGQVHIQFAKPLTVPAGQTLTVHMQW